MKTLNRYRSLYERLVANTRLEHEDNPESCWIWTGSTAGDSPYPRVPVRMPGKPHPINKAAHRCMLEELWDCEFPFDEADHLCHNPKCISPMHLEAATPAFNAAMRRNGMSWHGDHCMIPCLFPRATHAANDPDPWAGVRVRPGEPCPF